MRIDISIGEKSSSDALQLGLWTLGDPFLDAFESENLIDDLLQVRIVSSQVFFGHVVHVVENSSEIDVGPREL